MPANEEGSFSMRRSTLSLVIIALSLTGTLKSSQAQESRAIFDAPTVAGGVQSRFVGMGHIDNDGFVDVISHFGLDYVDVEIAAWRNDGTGRLEESWSIVLEHENFAGTEPFAVGDFTGDGLVDFAIAISTQILIYAADGSGGFEPERNWYHSDIVGELLIEDFDGNGYGDVLVIDRYDITLHLNLGDGSFDTRSAGAGVYISGYTPLAVELNGDDWLDIVLSSGGGARFYPIEGGVITRGPVFPQSGGKVAAGDIDGDDDVDLVQFQSTSFYILRRTGPATFERQGPFTGGPAAKLADIDGDGDLDGICCGGGGGGLRYNDDPSIFELSINPGDGMFEPAFQMPGLGSEEIVGAADLDHDGDADLVAGRCVYYADGPIAPRPEIPNGDALGDRGKADFDGDGDPDVGLAQGSVITNDGSAGLRVGAPTVAQAPAGTSFHGDGFVGDFDGDGDADLIVEHHAGAAFRAMRLLSNTGGGHYVDAGDAAAEGLRMNGSLQQWDSLARDVDGDGDIDLLVLPPGRPGTEVWLNSGTGSFELGFVFPVETAVADIADLNDDSIPDAVTKEPSRVQVWMGDGTGSFAVAGSIHVTHDNFVPEVADFDGDGDIDVGVFRNVATPSVFLNDGLGAFTEETPFYSTYYGELDAERRMKVVDINRDGIDDVMIFPLYRSPNAAQIYLGKGPGLDYEERIEQLVEWRTLMDCEGDGDLDIIGETLVRNRLRDPKSAGSRMQFGEGLPGTGGVTPKLGAAGSFQPGDSLEVRLTGGLGGGKAFVIVGTQDREDPKRGGTIYTNVAKVFAVTLSGERGLAGAGMWALDQAVRPHLTGRRFLLQGFVKDPAASAGIAFTRGLEIQIGE